jgi:hypothetical protein
MGHKILLTGEFVTHIPSNRTWRSNNLRTNVVYSAVYGAVVIDLIGEMAQ